MLAFHVLVTDSELNCIEFTDHKGDGYLLLKEVPNIDTLVVDLKGGGRELLYALAGVSPDINTNSESHGSFENREIVVASLAQADRENSLGEKTEPWIIFLQKTSDRGSMIMRSINLLL